MQIEMGRNRIPDDLCFSSRVIFAKEKVERLTAATHSEATLLQRRNSGLGETNVVQKRGRKMRFLVVFELAVRSEHRTEVIRAVGVRQQVLRMGGNGVLFCSVVHAPVTLRQVRK